MLAFYRASLGTVMLVRDSVRPSLSSIVSIELNISS